MSEDYKKLTEALWWLLQEIETTDHLAKADDKWFRTRVMEIQRRRFKLGISYDEKTVHFRKPWWKHVW